jgi:hypothetical protein
MAEVAKSAPERSTKLFEKNTSDALKVPGGFMFPLCLGVMASRQGTHVTIFLETFSNKSHGIKLDALDSLPALQKKIMQLMAIRYHILCASLQTHTDVHPIKRLPVPTYT